LNGTANNIAILTDSVAQVPKDIANELGIIVIPLSIIVEDQSFLDGVDITPATLYQRMRTEGIFPRTTHPSIGDYIKAFRGSLEEGAQSIIYYALSGSLSGGFSTATKAVAIVQEEFPDRDIEVFDTRMATIAQGFIVIEAARVARKGSPLCKVIDHTKVIQHKVGFAATLETLDYLDRGGRIGKASYMVGSLLSIKPILSINEDGVVVPLCRTRGTRKSLKRIVECIGEQVKGSTVLHLAVMHADALSQARELKQLAQSTFKPVEIFITDFTPVMAAHTGPGLVGLGYYYE